MEPATHNHTQSRVGSVRNASTFTHRTGCRARVSVAASKDPDRHELKLEFLNAVLLFGPAEGRVRNMQPEQGQRDQEHTHTDTL